MIKKIKNSVYKIRRVFEQKKIFLIYSMGKVGTTTVFSAIRSYYPDYKAYHVHFLSDYWVKQKLPQLHTEFHSNISIAEEVLQSISQNPNHRIKIITMVRDPLIREVSDIFQNWKGLLPEKNIHDLKPQDVFQYLNFHNHDFVLNWFDSEFKNYTKFDVFSVPFDKKRGYSIYRLKNADVLCLKTESLNLCLNDALKEFCNLKIPDLSIANSIETKQGNVLYKEVVQNYQPGLEKLKLLYNSKLVRHFYGEDEIDGFVKKWSRNKYNLTDL